MGSTPFSGTQQQWEEMVAKNNATLKQNVNISNDLSKLIEHILQNHPHENFPEIIKEIKLALLGFSQKVKENRMLELKELEETQSHIRRDIELIEDRMKLIDSI